MAASGSKSTCATSSGLESYFKNLKCHTGMFLGTMSLPERHILVIFFYFYSRTICMEIHLLLNTHPPHTLFVQSIPAGLLKVRRPDKFIFNHVEYLEGLTKIAIANLKFPAKSADDHSSGISEEIGTAFLDDKTSFDAASSADDELTEITNPEEGWMREYETGTSQSVVTLSKTVPRKRRTKFSVLNPQNIDLFGPEQIPILTNGFTGGEIQTYNTCAFDCLFSTVACLHRDCRKFRAVINAASSQYKSQFCTLIVKVVEANKVLKSTYIARNKILYNLAGYSGNIKQITSLNCETGFGGLFSAVCKENEVLASSIMNRPCETCESSKKIVCPFLPLLVEQLNITDLQCAIIDPTMQEEFCPDCHQLCLAEHRIGPLLALEVEPISPQAKQKHSVENITTQIEVGKAMFNLRGVIEIKQTQPRHFICHMLRKSGHWETYDDTAKSVTSLDISKEITLAMLFYIRSGKF